MFDVADLPKARGPAGLVFQRLFFGLCNGRAAKEAIYAPESIVERAAKAAHEKRGTETRRGEPHF
jgi:hypothetical protein